MGFILKEMGNTLAITGSILQIGPIIGICGTAVGMLSAFNRMGMEGSASPEALANDIGFALITTAIGLVLGILGWICMLIALFALKYRAQWFFWFLLIYSVVALFNFPVGTILGGLMLAFLISRRSEFGVMPSASR